MTIAVRVSRHHQRMLVALLALGLAPGLVGQGADRPSSTDRPASSSTDREVSTDREASTDRQGDARSAPESGPGPNVTGLGDLPAGETLRIVYQVSVDNVAFPAGKNNLSSQGTLTGSNIPATLTDDPAFGGTADPTLTPLDAAPDLQITAFGDGGSSTTPGATVAYAISYANDGSAGSQGASGVTLQSVVPANTTFNAGASTAGWVCSPDNNAGSTCTLAVGGLAAGGTGSATFAVAVVNPVPAGVTQIAASVTIADDGANGLDRVPANNSGADTTPLVAEPDLSVTKSDGGASVAPGGTVSYTLTYANVGNQGATGVVLTETVPANTTFNAGASTAGWVCVPDNNAGSTCTLSIGGVAAGGGTQNATFAATVVNPVPAGVSQVSNSSSVADDGGNGPDPTPANNTGADTTPITAEPDLSITKSDGGASVAPGGTVSYTLTYANVGNQGGTGVVLSETVPADTTFNPGASTAGWVCVPNNNAGSTCTLAIGALAAGSGPQNATFAVNVVNPVAAGLAQVSNTSTIADDNANGPDPTPANNTGSDTTPVTAEPDFTITKSDGGASVAPGGTVAYSLTYANVGNQGATGVALTETVPANTTFNAGASTAGWVCVPNNNAGSTCTLTIGGLTGGGTSSNATFAVTAVSPAPAGVTQISNTSSIADDGANGSDPTPANNSSSDTTPLNAAPDLSLTKSDGGASVAPGGTVAYTLTYTNVGDQDGTGVTLTETVPANATFNAGASTAGWVCVPDNNAGSTCTLAIGALAGAGGTGNATFAVTVVDPVPAGVTQISNTASAADDGNNGPDPNGGNNSGSDTTPVTADPDLALTKSDGGASVPAGGTVAYTLTYSNTGNQAATGVVLTETVPANSTFNAGASTAGWVCVPDNNPGSTCTLAVGSLAGGANGNATFAVSVAATLPSGVNQLSNTASAADDGSSGPDPTPANNSASDTTPVAAEPDLTISKTDNRSAVHGGQVLTYVLTYANVGTQDGVGVTLSETVPLNTTFFDPPANSGWSCAHGAPGGTACTFSVAGTLAAGAPAQTQTFRVKVNHNAGLGTVITNTVSVADDGSNGSDPVPANNTASDADTVVTPKGDMNQPGGGPPPFDVESTSIARTDILFQNETTARLVSWYMDYDSGATQAYQGGGNFTTPMTPSDLGFRAVGVDDFNDDGTNDILFRHNTDGRLLVWLMNGMLRQSEVTPTPGVLAGTMWQPGGTYDMNEDGQADFLWYNTSSARIVAWLMNGTTRITGQFTTPDSMPSTSYKVMGAGQFNLSTDTHADLLLQDAVGNMEVWLMNGNLARIGAAVPTTPASIPTGWEVVAIGDYNTDNQADLLFRNKTSGKLVVWFMNGTVRSIGTFTSPDSAPGGLAWRIVGPK